MKTTFKQFLKEDISIVGDSLQITTQNFQAGSNKESISTYFKIKPYTTSVKGVNAEIYSLMNYVTSEISSDILKSLKGSGPYKVNQKQFDSLMYQLKSAASILIKRIKPDVIIYPKSSSPLLTKFVNEIASTYPTAEVLSDRFIKSILDAENIEPLINTSHPDWKKFSEEHPDQVKLLKQSLKSHVKRGEIEMKKLYKPYLKFIKNFIEIKDSYEVLEKVMNNTILVVDDILSTGSTMAEMIRQLSEFEPADVYGLTIFKHTDSHK